MAIFTESDRTAIKEAMVTAAVAGVAEVAIGSERVRAYSLDDLRKILEMINADLATAQPHFGLRITQLVPPGCG